MKILHCSDIHLGKKPFGTKEFSQKRYLDFFRVFDEIIDKGIEEEISVFIVAGDLFDKKELTPDILQRCEKSFEKLKAKDIKTFIIEGNHDNINTDAVNSWTNYLQEKELLVRASYEIEAGEYKFKKFRVGDVNLYGLGYPGFTVDTVLEEVSKILDPEEKNIVIIHTALGGGEFLPGLASSEALKLLQDKAIYVAGGHLHSYQVYPKNNPFFFIPGSLEYWNVLNERSDTKGAIIFDTEDLTHKFIEVTPRKRVKLKFYPKELSNLNEELINFCKEQNLTGEELVIVSIYLKENYYVDVTELEHIVEENGALKGYIELKYSLEDREVEETTNYSVPEIEKSIISTWNMFEDSDKVTKYLQKFKELQGDKERAEDFFELFDKMLEEGIRFEDK